MEGSSQVSAINDSIACTRPRGAPEGAVRKMAAKLTPPRREEGFSRVTVVRE